jgi:hypothetical protein
VILELDVNHLPIKPSNKVELIQTNLDFEEELKKIESSFE